MDEDGIDREAIANMARRIELEFAKHPIRIPLQTDDQGLEAAVRGTTTIYNGPVIHGNVDGAQLAWGNHTVNQTAGARSDVTTGFEPLAQAVVLTLEQLRAVGLPDEDVEDAEAAGNEVLTEVTKPEPDRGAIRRTSTRRRLVVFLPTLQQPSSMRAVQQTRRGRRSRI